MPVLNLASRHLQQLSFTLSELFDQVGLLLEQQRRLILTLVASRELAQLRLHGLELLLQVGEHLFVPVGGGVLLHDDEVELVDFVLLLLYFLVLFFDLGC